MKADDVRAVVQSLDSATSKADLIDVARRRLILAFAEQNGRNSILFGDSTTRLAERTLSETAKGRGLALPWLTADSNFSGVDCIYPLRDLLRKELLAYAEGVSPSLTSLTIEPPVKSPTSSKDTTIDGLMAHYFESVEQNYPSIVANVVRTSGKLVPHTMSETMEACTLCGHVFAQRHWGGEQQKVTPSKEDNEDSTQDRQLCYGCMRTAS